MIIIKTDIEIQNSEQDELKSHDDVKQFINKYIYSNYKGAVLLSGKWGMGKTSFLKLIEEEVGSEGNQKDKRKFIWLNAWKRNKTETFYSDIFAKLHPLKYFYLKYCSFIFAMILAIIVGVIQFFPFIFKGKEDFITIKILFIWLGLFIINSALSYFKDAYDIENKCRNKVEKIINKRKLIFIIDDFDRIEKKQRNLLFQNMADINSFNNTLMIVVGEYKKIVENSNDIFTQKILQNIENMPEKYNSHNIWNYFEGELERILLKEVITDADRLIINRVRGQFIWENRTFRESKQLFNRFKNTYEYKKNRNFNPSELLALCYIFIFHNQIYEIITNTSIELTYGTSSTTDKELKKSIKEEITSNNIETNSILIEFIFTLFNHVNAAGMKCPSITKEQNLSLYKIESDKSTQINDGMIEEYLQKDQYEGLLILDRFNDEDYIRFFEMFKRKVIEEQILTSIEGYLKMMTNLIYYKFYGEHSSSGNSSLTTAYVDELLYSLSERLEMIFEIDRSEQCEKVVLKNKDLDNSQKILVIELIIQDIENIEIEKKIEMIENILKEIRFLDLKDTKDPRIIYWAYVKYYDQLQNKEIERVLNELICLDDSEFIEFIEKYFITSNRFYKSNGKNEIRKSFSLKEISFNEEFENRIIDKINQLEPQKRDEIKKSIRHAEKW